MNKREEIDDKSVANSKKIAKLNEDITLEIINLEFKEVEEWVKREIKSLKYESSDIIDSLKLKDDD
jgi:hypothetical protein